MRSCCRSIFVNLEPDEITHFDRDVPHIAARGVPWALLEFVLIASSDGAVVSSGYGLTAATIGGLTPHVTLLVKGGPESGGGRRGPRCLPSFEVNSVEI